MPAIAIPKRYKFVRGPKGNSGLAMRIGVKLDGAVRPLDVVEYDVEKGYIVTTKGERIEGKVEAYWR